MLTQIWWENKVTPVPSEAPLRGHLGSSAMESSLGACFMGSRANTGVTLTLHYSRPPV